MGSHEKGSALVGRSFSETILLQESFLPMRCSTAGILLFFHGLEGGGGSAFFVSSGITCQIGQHGAEGVRLRVVWVGLQRFVERNRGIFGMLGIDEMFGEEELRPYMLRIYLQRFFNRREHRLPKIRSGLEGASESELKVRIVARNALCTLAKHFGGESEIRFFEGQFTTREIDFAQFRDVLFF